ncbi:hypothetical protein BDF21DRAFT_396308 [Thamnidium elegans]|nr:hypothetical protein BDF21DRAFT_396308 [Thamnidium elegans]
MFSLYLTSKLLEFLLHENIYNSVILQLRWGLIMIHKNDIGSTKIRIESFSTARRNSAKFYNSLTKDTFIEYDEKKKYIKNWGNHDAKSGNGIKVDRFTKLLYQLFKKGQDNWNKDDLFSLKAISNFMCLSVEELIKESNQEIKDTGALHYMFIVPSEWEEEIREAIIRPVFVQANLISIGDHSDRLLFCSDLESFYYDKSEIFKVAKDTLFCRFTPIDKEQVMIKLDLVSCVNTLFDFSGSMLFPKVVNSKSFVFSITHIKDSIGAFLKANSALRIQDKNLQSIIEAAFSGVPSNLDENIDDRMVLMTPLITDTSKWGLDASQEAIVKSIRPYDIFVEIGKNLLHDLISNNHMKEYYIMTLVDEYSSEIILDQNLVNWSKGLLEYNRMFSNLRIRLYEYHIAITFSFDFIHHGSIVYVREAIQNSDLYSKPRILPSSKIDYSLSVFKNSKPDAIMNIDFSEESTQLSFSLLDNNGLIKKIWDHNYFIQDTHLCSLGSYFNFSKVQTLNINYSFIKFAEKYLKGESIILSDDTASSKEIMTEIEVIMNMKSHDKELLASIQQPVCIKAFIAIYMIYLRNIVSSKLVSITGHIVDIKIGYSITIEKMLLDNLFGTKAYFEEVVYTSGLIRKDDHRKKLRVITQGEGLLPVIQKFWKLQFPVKSFFVVAQLYQDYVQLTLNQVVTEDKKDQEATIIQDEIIHIPNFYRTLCLNMWNNIVEDTSLIQMCDKHKKHTLLEIFSVQNQKYFSSNIKRYLSNNILNTSSISQVNEKTIINISTSCSCRVSLLVDDIIEICFRPIIQDVVSLVSTSLFQPILVKMLEDETDQYTYEQEIDIPHYIIPDLSNQLLQPVLQQQPFSYKGFLVGVLHHICSENYGFGFYFPKECEGFSLKNNSSDTKSISINRETVFPIFKRGDKITSSQNNRFFYVNSQTKTTSAPFWINSLRLGETVPSKDISEKITTSYIDTSDINKVRYLPIVISIVYNGYSSSFSLSVKIVGGELTADSSVIVGEPMTLARF